MITLNIPISCSCLQFLETVKVAQLRISDGPQNFPNRKYAIKDHHHRLMVSCLTLL